MIQGASFLENDSNKADMKLQLVHELWKSAKTKVGGIFAMVISSENLIRQYRDGDHGKDAPHFAISTRLENYHAEQTYYAFNFNCERERLRNYFD